MPKAAFQFGVKMQDGRKTRKQNKDQKLNNELHQINKILAKKKIDKENGDGGHYDDDTPPGKKQRQWSRLPSGPTFFVKKVLLVWMMHIIVLKWKGSSLLF